MSTGNSTYTSTHLVSAFSQDEFSARNTRKWRSHGWAILTGIAAPLLVFELPFALAGVKKAIFVSWFTLLVMAPFILIGLLMAGPYELTCDLKQGTYRYKAGFPFLYKTWTGPLSDFAAVTYHRPSPSVQRAGIPGSWVRLEWKQVPTLLGIAPYRWLPIVQARSEQDALEVARWVADRLSLSVYPAYTKGTMAVQVGSKSPFAEQATIKQRPEV